MVCILAVCSLAVNSTWSRGRKFIDDTTVTRTAFSFHDGNIYQPHFVLFFSSKMPSLLIPKSNAFLKTYLNSHALLEVSEGLLGEVPTLLWHLKKN